MTSRNSLVPSDMLRFRCRLESADGKDAHRSFTGVYYPRWRALYVDEIKESLGKVKLTSVLPFDVYLNPQVGDRSDFYYTSDFVLGATLRFDRCDGGEGSVADKFPGSLDVLKCFVVTHVDDSQLRTQTESGREASLASTLRRDVPSDVVKQLIQVRAAFSARCGELSIKAIGRRFRTMDDSGNRLVSREEFQKCLNEVHLHYSSEEVKRIFDAFDTNQDGQLSYEELLLVMRGPMSDVRKSVVQQAFAKLDADRDGQITIAEIGAKYRAASHPDVVAGHLTEKQVLSAFASVWDSRDRNGIVTFAEFSDYYSGVSAGVDSDEAFVELVRAAWKL